MILGTVYLRRFWTKFPQWRESWLEEVMMNFLAWMVIWFHVTTDVSSSLAADFMKFAGTKIESSQQKRLMPTQAGPANAKQVKLEKKWWFGFKCKSCLCEGRRTPLHNLSEWKLRTIQALIHFIWLVCINHVIDILFFFGPLVDLGAIVTHVCWLNAQRWYLRSMRCVDWLFLNMVKRWCALSILFGVPFTEHLPVCMHLGKCTLRCILNHETIHLECGGRFQLNFYVPWCSYLLETQFTSRYDFSKSIMEPRGGGGCVSKSIRVRFGRPTRRRRRKPRVNIYIGPISPVCRLGFFCSF